MMGALLDSGDGTLRQQSIQQLRELVVGGAAGHEVVAWFDGLPSARLQQWPDIIDKETALLPKLQKVLSDENHFQVRACMCIHTSGSALRTMQYPSAVDVG
jgi:hypothetical protein